MKDGLLELLKCTRCGNRLSIIEAQREGNEIITGKVACPEGHAFPILRGVLRTVESDDYTASFSFEWQLHAKTQLDRTENGNSARVFYYKTGLKPTDLAGARVLEVGVGAGRFADVCRRAGADIVGIDLSYAVESAMENVGIHEHANIIQANAFDLPFQDESFDIIYSIGVLDHTPDCEKAFRGLVRFLKPGGTIVIWVYDGHTWAAGSLMETVNCGWRAMTSRLPPRLLYALCYLELPLYYFRKIPWADKLMHLLFPGVVYHAIPITNNHPRVAEHLLDTFDWYSPKYQSKHTYPEVFQWFEEMGLEHMRVNPHPVGISGKKRHRT